MKGMKRIFGVFFVLGLTISTLAFNLPTKAQSNLRVFNDPTKGDNIPVDVVVKGASGLDEEARQKGANAFCRANQYTAAVNFEWDRDSTVGTMQWNPKTFRWEFCEECKLYFTKITCK